MWDVLQADESSEAECELTISTNICQQQLMKYLRSIPNGTGWDSITMHRVPPHFSQLCLTWGRRVNSLFRGLNKSCCFYHFERKEKPTKIEMETSHPPFPPPTPFLFQYCAGQRFTHRGPILHTDSLGFLCVVSRWSVSLLIFVFCHIVTWEFHRTTLPCETEMLSLPLFIGFFFQEKVLRSLG